MPWKMGWEVFLIDGWSKEYSMQVGVWVKGKVCWCECWQIARRCRNSELPSSSCFLTAPDFFQRTDVQQSQGRYGRAQGLTMWVKYDASITNSQQSDYDSITEYRVHLIWSMDTMFDLPLTCPWFCLNGEDKQQQNHFWSTTINRHLQPMWQNNHNHWWKMNWV